MIGPAVAKWLVDRIDPSRVYEDTIFAELEPLGILFDHSAHQIYMLSGEIANVPVYTPADLVHHPVVQISNVHDPGPDITMVLGYEIPRPLHELLWPSEMPPGDPRAGWIESFDADVRSIAQRTSEVPYRAQPPGGWWQAAMPEMAVTRRRR
jgi:hypothetical protein